MADTTNENIKLKIEQVYGLFRKSLLQKLASRKFWVALIAMGLQAAVLFGADASVAKQYVALAGTVLTAIAYVAAESHLDNSALAALKAAAEALTATSSSEVAADETAGNDGTP